MSKSIDDSKLAIRSCLSRTTKLDSPIGVLSSFREIGEGGNAVVYRAEFEKGREVAVKFLAIDAAGGFQTKHHRFLAEYREIIVLADSGLVASPLASGFLELDDEKYPYIVMKKYDATLAKWRATNSPSTLADLLPVLDNLLACVESIHAAKIVHRDIKPQNIFVAANNRFVLGDFGIAWYDPTFFERVVHTTTDERLANFRFSAPEQSRSGAVPAPTMDIFALGQLIQWLVVGDTHSGVGRVLLSSRHASFMPLDRVVDAMLQQDPVNRPQTIGEVRALLDGALSTSAEKRSNPWFGLRQIDILLSRNFPGKYGLLHLSARDKIDNFMEQLSVEVRQIEMWMVRGRETNEIRKLKSLGNGVWLVDVMELQVDGIWVYKHSTDYRSYIILECGPRPSFGFYDEPLEWEEAAWFGDRYIRRGEYDDGFANIDGHIVELGRNAELRVRETGKRFWFVGAVGSNIVQVANDEVVEFVVDNLTSVGEIQPELLEPLERLRMNRQVWETR